MVMLLAQHPMESRSLNSFVLLEHLVLLLIVGSNNFSAQFIKITSHYKKICFNINVLQQTACLVVNPIMVGHFAFLFICTPVGRTSESMTVLTKRLIYWSDGRGLMLCLLSGPREFAWLISVAPVFSFMYCWVLILAESPFYILIYMLGEMKHR